VDVANADFACHQEPEDSKTRRIGESLESVFDLLQLIRHIFALTNISVLS
jgi:hypothetical protein